MNVMRATRNVVGPDGEPVDLAQAVRGAAYRCRLGLFRKTIVVWFPSPPEPSRLENARRAAGSWRVKVRLDPRGAPPRLIEGGGTAGVQEPRRPVSPAGPGQAEAQEPTDED
jgi:hypothetical protein